MKGLNFIVNGFFASEKLFRNDYFGKQFLSDWTLPDSGEAVPQNLSLQETMTQYRWITGGGKAFVSKWQKRRAVVPLSEDPALRKD